MTAAGRSWALHLSAQACQTPLRTELPTNPSAARTQHLIDRNPQPAHLRLGAQRAQLRLLHGQLRGHLAQPRARRVPRPRAAAAAAARPPRRGRQARGLGLRRRGAALPRERVNAPQHCPALQMCLPPWSVVHAGWQQAVHKLTSCPDQA